jgi:hypothetical protein
MVLEIVKDYRFVRDYESAGINRHGGGDGRALR